MCSRTKPQSCCRIFSKTIAFALQSKCMHYCLPTTQAPFSMSCHGRYTALVTVHRLTASDSHHHAVIHNIFRSTVLTPEGSESPIGCVSLAAVG